MSSSLQPAATSCHRKCLDDVSPTMAKADLKRLAIEHFRAEIGRMLDRAIGASGLSKKEAAALMECDAAQLARWIAGSERLQLDKLLMVEALRKPLICALAQLVGAQVITRISFDDEAKSA